MQGRARGRKGERKTYHINPYHHITMEFGRYLLDVAKTPTRARARKGEAQGSYPTKKQQEFSTTPKSAKMFDVVIEFRFGETYFFLQHGYQFFDRFRKT